MAVNTTGPFGFGGLSARIVEVDRRTSGRANRVPGPANSESRDSLEMRADQQFAVCNRRYDFVPPLQL
jgi:hypothetical protein